MGAALATNSVSVNSASVDRKGEYFHRQISVANTNQPVWQNVTNISGSFTNKGGLVFPANSQALVYDADGNLSFDGVWNYQWDGENRLISMNMTNVSSIANSNRLQLQFAYDFMGRRVQKIVSAWNGSAFVSQSTNRFVYDGWNLLAILNPQSSILQSFTWGQDLSGTMTGAGGVGGLLMASISGTNCFAAYDGNGNITSLINATDYSLAARYEYSPYGELLRETGLLAHQMPFGYSTKFRDEESGLVYYNFRFYNPYLGKWIGRDPTTDQILLQLYLFCHNSPIGRFDSNGKIDYALIFTGAGNVAAGTAFAGLLAAGDAATGGFGMLVSGSAFVGTAMMVAVGLDEIFDGLTSQGSVSPYRNNDFNFPTSVGGAIGRILGGQEGQQIGDFLDASGGLAQQAAGIGCRALDRVVAGDVAFNLTVYAIAFYADSPDDN
jgi:RHS repeat-associated protein